MAHLTHMQLPDYYTRDKINYNLTIDDLLSSFTIEEKLDSIDIKDIEKYLRDKKLKRIDKK